MFGLMLIRARSAVRQGVLPLGLLSLAAYARRELDCQVGVVDGLVEQLDPGAVAARVRAFSPKVIGIGAMGSDAAEATALARRLGPLAPWLVLGGPHPSAAPVAMLEASGADFAVIGEGELPFTELVRALQEGDLEAARGIAGVAWRDEQGRVRLNPAGELVEDLDRLPLPAFDLIDIERYFRGPLHPQVSGFRGSSRPLAYLSSRGCPYSCLNCHRLFGSRFRAHSPERVASDLDELERRYGITEFEIVDDVFNLDRKRVLRICELLSGGRLTPLSFSNGLRADHLDGELVEALISAGTYRFCFGIESAVDEVRQRLRKRLDLDDVVEAVDNVTRRGALAGGYFMLGLPGETEPQARQTIEFAVHSRLHQASFHFCTPFPGTGLAELAEVGGRSPVSAPIRFDRSSTNLSRIPDDRLRRLRREAYVRFYTRPTRILRVLRDAPRLGPLLDAGGVMLRYLILRRDLYT